MDESKNINNIIKTYLIDTFDVIEWSSKQYETYKLIKQYVNNFKENNRIHESRDDKKIIRNNLKDQSWFTFSKAKPIISHLLDEMKLTNYTFDHNQCCLNFNIVLSFNHFQLIACLYKNYINSCVNYYILFENNQKQRAYLTYYTSMVGTILTDAIKNIRLPEFDKIYEIIGINQNIFYQSDLLNFFAEIIMYYDDSSTIGDLPMGHDLSISINQLIEKFNAFLIQKKSESNYTFQ